MVCGRRIMVSLTTTINADFAGHRLNFNASPSKEDQKHCWKCTVGNRSVDQLLQLLILI